MNFIITNKVYNWLQNASKAQKFDAWISLQMQVNVQVDKSMCKMLKDAPEGAKQVLTHCC